MRRLFSQTDNIRLYGLGFFFLLAPNAVYAAVNLIVKGSGLIHFINKIKIKWLVIYLATNILHCEIIGNLELFHCVSDRISDVFLS